MIVPRLLLMLLVAALAQAEEPDPDQILNFHEISPSLGTAGQVFPLHLPRLKSEGYTLVVNLGVARAESNLEESFHVTGTGMSYVQIPVAWETPSADDLQLFFAVMDARQGRKTLVHCFANYRASAFTYLYRIKREGVPEPEARKDLMAVWNDEAFAEYPQWREFIDAALP